MRIASSTLPLTVLAILALTGCSILGPAQSSTSTSESLAEETPTPAVTALTDPTPASGAPETMTFDDGADIDPDALPQWTDSLLTNEEWDVSSPDNGAGRWEYATVDGACTASFYQGEITDMTSTDDRDASEFILAAVVQRPQEWVATTASTAKGYYLQSGGKDADFLLLTGESAGTSLTFVARGFAQTTSALTMTMTCTEGDSYSTVEDVLSETGVFIG